MALFRSDRITQASGSIGGTTFSHNRFGLYFRARRSPVNPNTTFQQSQRDALAAASAGWRSLTAGQRAGWEAYAASTPTTNALGETVFLAGAGQYVATNAYAARIGLSPILDAPTTPGRQALGSPVTIIDVSSANAVVSNLEAAVDAADVSLYLGDPVSAGVSFFAGPYQLRGTGNPLSGVLTIGTLTGRNGLALVAGQRLPWRVRGLMPDGRLTTVATGLAVVVA